MTYFEQNEDRRSLLSAYSLLGDLYFKKGEGVRSVPFYNRVEAMSEDMGLSYIRHKNLYSLYVALKSTGRYPEALEAIETYNRLKDSLVTESRSYAKSAVDNQLERDLMRNELDLYRSRARERNLLTLSLLLLVLLGVTIPLLYARHQRLIKEREKSQLRLRILHMQMNPHFIFNALNSVQGYVLNDEKEPALNYIGDISDMMRKTLEASSKEVITLSDEIAFVKSYFKLQCRRISNQVACNVLADLNNGDDHKLLVPPMLTQPLIENVFEHARLESEKSPRIVVSYKKLNDELEVTIEDNGVGFDVANLNEKHEGHKPFAFEIIKERLSLLRKMHKGGRSQIEITNLASEGLKGTRVRFWLPLIYNT